MPNSEKSDNSHIVMAFEQSVGLEETRPTQGLPPLQEVELLREVGRACDAALERNYASRRWVPHFSDFWPASGPACDQIGGGAVSAG
jgi:hypothetical protein